MPCLLYNEMIRDYKVVTILIIRWGDLMSFHKKSLALLTACLLGISGAVLADQVKSLDWRARNAKRFGVAPEGVLDEVLAKILTLVGE